MVGGPMASIPIKSEEQSALVGILINGPAGNARIPLIIPTTDVNENHMNTVNMSPISSMTDQSPPAPVSTAVPSTQSFNSPMPSDQDQKVIPYTPNAGSSSTPSRSSHRRNSDHIKRPMNAFLIWSTRRRHEIKEKEPQITMAEISKILGQEWKDMTMEERQPFIDQAKQIRAEHMLKYPDYKYQPRRKKNQGVAGGKVKTVGGYTETPTAVKNTNPIERTTLPSMPMTQNNPMHISTNSISNQQLISNSNGQTFIYHTTSGHPVLANRIVPQQNIQLCPPKREAESYPQEQPLQPPQQQHQLQMATTSPLSQPQQVVVTSPCLVPATGGQPAYTVILPSNHNGMPIYLQALPQQQPQGIIQDHILTSPQSGTLAQPPIQTSPQLEAAVQHPQNQLQALQTQLPPQIITAAGDIVVSGNSLHSMQSLSEGQVPFSQM